jgi:hypothetical protein
VSGLKIANGEKHPARTPSGMGGYEKILSGYGVTRHDVFILPLHVHRKNFFLHEFF